jgi:polysaccharide biosynthesis protein PslH
MKILLLCNKSPWPLREGGPMAIYAIIDGLLKAGHQVKVLAANTNKYFTDPASVPQKLATDTKIEFAYIDLSVKPLGALYHLLSGQSYHVARFRNKDFKEKLISILKKDTFDMIQCEMLYTTVYLDVIRKYSNAPVILRAHNIEHLIWKRIADNSKNPLKRHYLKHLFLTLRDYELETIDKVDGIVAITGKDAEFFKKQSSKTPVISVPFGIEVSQVHETPVQDTEPDLFHIGSMNWIPNAEGIRWFLEKVWPGLHKEFPSLKFYLAGRMMPEWLIHTKLPNVIIEGEVPDSTEFISKHSVMVVPLFSGSGIRIKIIEAMAAGKTIVSTSVGAEGIQYQDGEDLMIADNRELFIDSIRKLMSNNKLRMNIGQNAKKVVMNYHNNQTLIHQLTLFYEELLTRHY